MWFHFIMLAAVLPDPEAIPVSVKLMSFDDPQREVAVLNAAGKPVVIQLYSHSLTAAITSQVKAGKFSVFGKPADQDPKSPYPVLASAALPPGENKLIAIVSGAGAATRISLVPDKTTDDAAGTIRFFNLCPQPVGLSMPGERRVIPSGKDITLKPKVKPSEYGQAQFFLPNEDDGWQVAGGLRWLQLQDIRSILFLLPAPGDTGMIVVRGVEERIVDELAPAAAPPGNMQVSKNKALR
jgi:hypothetical protein